MINSTSAWLAPMLEAWSGTPEEMTELVEAAVVPVDESGGSWAVDWPAFGRLLRERLGWSSWPEHPPDDDDLTR